MRFFLLLLIAFSCTVSYGDTLVFKNNSSYSGSTDSYLVMNTDKAQGQKELLVLEGYHCSACIDQRVLIKFDLTTIDTTSIIDDAYLSLYCYDQPRPGAGKVNVYTTSRPWDEVTATWYKATSNDSWLNSGGDYSNTAQVYNYGTATKSWHVVNVTNFVRSFIKNPSTNNGFYLYMQPLMLTVRYVSADYPDASLHPALTVIRSSTGIRQTRTKVTADQFTIHLNNDKLSVFNQNPDGIYRIVTSEGSCVLSIPTSRTMVVPVGNLAAGMYTLLLQNSSPTVAKTFLIK